MGESTIDLIAIPPVDEIIDRVHAFEVACGRAKRGLLLARTDRVARPRPDVSRMGRGRPSRVDARAPTMNYAHENDLLASRVPECGELPCGPRMEPDDLHGRPVLVQGEGHVSVRAGAIRLP